MPAPNALIEADLTGQQVLAGPNRQLISSILGSGVRECQDESGRHKLGQRRCYVHFATVGQTDSFSIAGATRVCQVVACS
jgi:hypothetical protein